MFHLETFMLRLPKFKHVKLSSLNEILDILAKNCHEVQVLAGGTDLLVNMKNGLYKPKIIVSLNAFPQLSYISKASDGSIRIGAGTKLIDLLENPLITKNVPLMIYFGIDTGGPLNGSWS